MSRQQEWAKGALTAVTKVGKGGNKASAKKYKTACMKGASLVQRVGALQAMAFWLSRSDEEFRAFAEDLSQVWHKTSADSIRKVLIEADPDAYLTMTRDLTEVALWFRRMAQAELREVDEG
jgi:CRISPR/Cas system CMR-associated protein Cmr5 small subunit